MCTIHNPARLTAISLLAAAVLLVGSPGFAQITTSPGKTAVFSRDFLGMLPTASASILSAQIVKGKSKSVVRLDATVRYEVEVGSPPGCDLDLRPQVNGTDMGVDIRFPIFGDGTASDLLVANGSWWLDLDAAEAANPGSFKNKPLNIELLAEDRNGPSSPCAGPGGMGEATMSVEMVKK
jgi:hypothetical protein